MHIEAIYCQGRLDLVAPVIIKQGHFRVVGDVPEEAIEAVDQFGNLPLQVVAHVRAMRQMQDAARSAPPAADDGWPAASDRQRQRLEAFELREDL